MMFGLMVVSKLRRIPTLDPETVSRRRIFPFHENRSVSTVESSRADPSVEIEDPPAAKGRPASSKPCTDFDRCPCTRVKLERPMERFTVRGSVLVVVRIHVPCASVEVDAPVLASATVTPDRGVPSRLITAPERFIAELAHAMDRSMVDRIRGLDVMGYSLEFWGKHGYR